MSGVVAKALVNSKAASTSDNTEYTTPGSTHTIIDKFTATNTNASSQTLDVHLVPSGGSVGATNLIVKAATIAAGATFDSSELKNHILNAGDFISVKASSTDVTIRASGREIS